MAAAVVADGGTDVVGNRVEAAQQLLQAPLSELGVLGQRIVEIRDVGLVMFAVVDLHGLRVNVRLQRREIVRQRGEADAATKSGATQKLVPRALAWFRWSALLTFLTGAAIIGKRIGESPEGSAAWSSPWAVTILTGALFGTVMLANVWRVIWPKQK